MKNSESLILLIITILLIGVMLGLLAGRYWAQHGVQLSAYDREHMETTQNEDADKTVGKININFATINELTMLPGIGETTAQRIIAYRNEHGPFATIYGLENVEGIGKKRIESIAQYITVGGQS